MKPSERKISAEMSFKEVYAIEERKINVDSFYDCHVVTIILFLLLALIVKKLKLKYKTQMY